MAQIFTGGRSAFFFVEKKPLLFKRISWLCLSKASKKKKVVWEQKLTDEKTGRKPDENREHPLGYCAMGMTQTMT